jgi:hypothetical protein
MVPGCQNSKIVGAEPDPTATGTTVKRYGAEGYRDYRFAALGATIPALFPNYFLPGIGLHFFDEFLFVPVYIFVFQRLFPLLPGI